MSSPEGLSSHVLAHAHSALTLPQGQYTVLAAFVITSLSHGPKTLALATGAKVLPTSRIPDAGDAPRLHDSHAEVLARRALVRWLYEEIARDIEGEGSMWLVREEGRWGLRDGVQLHLYVSTPPCMPNPLYLNSAADTHESRRRRVHTLPRRVPRPRRRRTQRLLSHPAT